MNGLVVKLRTTATNVCSNDRGVVQRIALTECEVWVLLFDPSLSLLSGVKDVSGFGGCDCTLSYLKALEDLVTGPVEWTLEQRPHVE